jgi:acetoin utilization deacetylase AcuC-like enzyme
MTTQALAGLPVVWSADCLLHEPAGEVWLGVWETGTEVPERASVLLEAVTEAGATVTAATPHDVSTLVAVHDAELVEHLATIWSQWQAGGYERDYGRSRVVPYVFPTPGLLGDLPMRSPAAIHGRAGRFCYDTMTLVGPGSWEAIKAAADAALTAADLVAAGTRTAYALCRPPGHHTTRSAYGGSCYLNNAAIAAQALRSSGAERVAVIDIDAHHGNGTQAIFYDRDDVFFLSLHSDPKWDFPYFLGFADEVGEDKGEGFNANYPMPWGTAWDRYVEALRDAIARIRRYAPDVIVVSLGVDTFKADPISKFKLEMADYPKIGAMIAELGRPTLFVMEGGYAVEEIGINTVALLQGFEG